MNTVPVHLLKLIAAGAPYATPEETLRIDIRRVVPGTSGGQISSAFTQLENQKLAISTKDELSGDMKWSVTEVGKTKLVELGA